MPTTCVRRHNMCTDCCPLSVYQGHINLHRDSLNTERSGQGLVQVHERAGVRMQLPFHYY